MHINIFWIVYYLVFSLFFKHVACRLWRKNHRAPSKQTKNQADCFNYGQKWNLILKTSATTDQISWSHSQIFDAHLLSYSLATAKKVAMISIFKNTLTQSLTKTDITLPYHRPNENNKYDDATICRGSFGSESGSVRINLNLNKKQLCATLSCNAQYFFHRNFQFSSHTFFFRFAPSSLVAAQFELFFFSCFWLKVFFIVPIWALICLHKVLCVVILLLLQPIEIYTFVWEIN